MITLFVSQWFASRLARWILATFWMLVTAGLVYPSGDAFSLPHSIQFRFWDKVLHFGAYFVGGWLFCMTESARDRFLRKKPYDWADALDQNMRYAVLCFIHGTFFEMIQIYIPHRAFSMFDILANASGGLAGSLVAYFVFLATAEASVPLESVDGNAPVESQR